MEPRYICLNNLPGLCKERIKLQVPHQTNSEMYNKIINLGTNINAQHKTRNKAIE